MRTSPLRVKIMVFSVRSIMQPTTSPGCQGRPNGSLPKCQRWPYKEVKGRCGVGEIHREMETCRSKERHVNIHMQGIRFNACEVTRGHPHRVPILFHACIHDLWNVRDRLSCFPVPLTSVFHPFCLSPLLFLWLGVGLCRPPKP